MYGGFFRLDHDGRLFIVSINLLVRCLSSLHAESHKEVTFPLLPYHTGVSSAIRPSVIRRSPTRFIRRPDCLLLSFIKLLLLQEKKNDSKDSALPS